MKKLINVFVLAALFLFSFPALAQEKALLWRVSGNDMQKPSYVFGTMHLMCDKEFVRNAELEKILAGSEKLVLELDPTDPQLATAVQQLSVNPRFENIYSALPAEDYRLIDGFLLAKLGSGLEQMGVLKPFVLTSLVSMGFFDCEQPYSMEIEFATAFKASNREVVSLETAGYQMGLFDSIPREIQMNEIVRQIKGDAGKAELDRMTEAYLAKDLEKLSELMSSNPLFARYGNELLDNRNRSWIMKLETLLANNSCFVAVGAGHLAGEDGVINLLRNKGYRVEPVTF